MNSISYLAYTHDTNIANILPVGIAGAIALKTASVKLEPHLGNAVLKDFAVLSGFKGSEVVKYTFSFDNEPLPFTDKANLLPTDNVLVINVIDNKVINIHINGQLIISAENLEQLNF